MDMLLWFAEMMQTEYVKHQSNAADAWRKGRQDVAIVENNNMLMCEFIVKRTVQTIYQRRGVQL